VLLKIGKDNQKTNLNLGSGGNPRYEEICVFRLKNGKESTLHAEIWVAGVGGNMFVGGTRVPLPKV
jgi:hypothetical protein